MRSSPHTLNGFGTNRSPVRSPRPQYPRANPTPARHNSPATPNGTASIPSSTTYKRIFALGLPIATLTWLSSLTHFQYVTSIAASVGPYRLCNSAHAILLRHPCASSAGSASPLHITRLILLHCFGLSS